MLWPPLVITVAPNGARKDKRDHPAVPLTSGEIAATAAECLETGAAMVHLHVRDAGGRHTLDPDAYRSAIGAIRGAVGDRLVIQVTSEAAGRYHPQAQMDAVRALKPESVSLALRELVPDTNQLQPFAAFLEWAVSERVLPQYILFSVDDLIFYRDLVERGVIPSLPHWLLFVLGRYDPGSASGPSALLPFLADRETDVPWAVCAFGRSEHACAACALTLGGHVRVGFENNLYLKDGATAERNAQLIQQVYDVAVAVGRPVADAAALREMFRTA